MTADKYVFVPIENFVEPPSRGYVDVFSDYWWNTRGGTELALFEGRSPQCNSNEFITRKIAAQLHFENAVVVQIPRIYLPFRIFDKYYAGEYEGWDMEYVLTTESGP